MSGISEETIGSVWATICSVDEPIGGDPPSTGNLQIVNNLSDLQSIPTARAILSAPVYATNRSLMYALDDDVVILTEKGREGLFVKGVLPAPYDPLEGVYVGQYVRAYSGPLNVCWFGAKADSATNCTPAFQAAHDLLPVIFGGAVRIPAAPYRYMLAYPGVKITTNTVTFMGDCRRTTVIGITNHTFDIFDVSSAYFFQLKNVLVVASGTPWPAQYIVNAPVNRGVTVDAVDCVGKMSSAFRINFAESKVWNCSIRELMPYYGIFVDLDTPPTISEVCQIKDCNVFNGDNLDCFAGVYTTGGGPIEMTNVQMAKCGVPFFANISSGKALYSIVMNNVWHDTSSGMGMYLKTTGTGIISRVRLDNSWFCSNANGGILINGNVYGVTVDDCEIGRNGASGITVVAGSVLNGMIIGSSNKMPNNAGDAITIGAGVKDFQIGLNKLGPCMDFGGNTGCAIRLGAGADEYVIANNNTLGNAGGGIIGHVAGPTRICVNNL